MGVIGGVNTMCKPTFQCSWNARWPGKSRDFHFSSSWAEQQFTRGKKKKENTDWFWQSRAPGMQRMHCCINNLTCNIQNSRALDGKQNKQQWKGMLQNYMHKMCHIEEKRLKTETGGWDYIKFGLWGFVGKSRELELRHSLARGFNIVD